MAVPPACWNYLRSLLKNTGSQTLPSKLQGSRYGARPGLAPPVLQSTLAWGVLAIPAPCICRYLTYPRRPFPTHWTPYSPFEAQFKCSPSSSKPGHTASGRMAYSSSVAPEHNMGLVSPLTLTSFSQVS